MVVVKSLDRRPCFVVVGEASVVPVETAYTVGAGTEVDICFVGYSMPHKGVDVECIARQMNGYCRTTDAEAVGIDAPSLFTLRRVNGSRIAQGNVEIGICESCTVHLHSLAFQVDAVRAQPQLAHASFHL